MTPWSSPTAWTRPKRPSSSDSSFPSDYINNKKDNKLVEACKRTCRAMDLVLLELRTCSYARIIFFRDSNFVNNNAVLMSLTNCILSRVQKSFYFACHRVVLCKRMDNCIHQFTKKKPKEFKIQLKGVNHKASIHT